MRRFTTTARVAARALGTALLAAGIAGCAGPEADDTPAEGGFFTNYELGNDQDMLEEKASRPAGAKYE